ncbi:unnamed protein product [Cylindrotheca closterium]|uniref:Uncharacterized protein n=1 Tax=Cylindrotheca closterium TaxID=2856 RepID=A0AAD2GBP0_9STRA|nr:unnamed protein product [Cylindrotheca closterium]
MSSPFDRAIQFCESLFRGLPHETAVPDHHPDGDHDHDDDDHGAESVHSWGSFESFRKSMAAPLIPQEPNNKGDTGCRHTKDGNCVSNISSGKKVLMFDEKTFQFKLTNPL